MGFCLFEHAETRGVFFAVNGAHVAEIRPEGSDSQGRPVCRLVFEFEPAGFEPLAVGGPAEVESLMREAAKIALMKAEVQILSGRERVSPRPLLLNDPGRIALVRELLADEFPESGDDSFVTASEMFMADGTPRRIVERPGTFVLRANVGMKAPILKA